MNHEPTAAEIRISLARILASPSFARARRAQMFLRFVVDETLAGRSQTINGYTIAVAAFRKPADFDAANDPLVRVEAGRVRTRLRNHYAGAGRTDRVRIELRVGNYVPTFGYAATPLPPAVEVRQTRRRSAAPLAALPALGLVAVVWALGIGTQTPSSTAADGPAAAVRVIVKTFRNVGSEESLALVFTEELMTRLGENPSVRVVVAPGNDLTVGHRNTKRHVAGDYALTGSVTDLGHTIRVQPRLVDAHTGRLVWTTVYDEPLAAENVWHLVDDVAAAVARHVGAHAHDTEIARATDHAGAASSRP